MTPSIRTMPQDRVSEETILSAILTSGAEAMDLCDSLTPAHFYTRGNRIIYEACVSVFAEVPTVETMSVISKLKTRGQLEEVGGIHRLNQIASAYVTTANLGYYVKLLNDKLMLRRVIEASTRAIQSAHERQDDAEAVLAMVETEALALRDGLGVSGDANELGIACDEVEKQIALREDKKHGSLSMPSGIKAWDNAFCGIMEGRSYLVAGRPGLGKTALVEMISETAARSGSMVLWISLDMRRERLISRMAARAAGVSYTKWLRGYVSAEDSEAMRRATAELRGLPFHVWSPAVATAQQIRGIIRRAARKGCKLWILDYFGKINVAGGREKRNEAFAEASVILHQAIKETNVPGLILVQLSRESEKEHLQLRHLSETSQLEKDADCVVMIDCDDMKANPREVSLAFEKNRDGALGFAKVLFHGATMRFEDKAEDE